MVNGHGLMDNRGGKMENTERIIDLLALEIARLNKEIAILKFELERKQNEQKGEKNE